MKEKTRKDNHKKKSNSAPPSPGRGEDLKAKVKKQFSSLTDIFSSGVRKTKDKAKKRAAGSIIADPVSSSDEVPAKKPKGEADTEARMRLPVSDSVDAPVSTPRDERHFYTESDEAHTIDEENTATDGYLSEHKKGKEKDTITRNDRYPVNEDDTEVEDDEMDGHIYPLDEPEEPGSRHNQKDCFFTDPAYNSLQMNTNLKESGVNLHQDKVPEGYISLRSQVPLQGNLAQKVVQKLVNELSTEKDFKRLGCQLAENEDDFYILKDSPLYETLMNCINDFWKEHIKLSKKDGSFKFGFIDCMSTKLAKRLKEELVSQPTSHSFVSLSAG